MSFDFNVLNNVSPIKPEDVSNMTVGELGKLLNAEVKRLGLEFEENDFTVITPLGESAIISNINPLLRIQTIARSGNNEGFYVYVCVTSSDGMKSILSSKGWTWQNMVAIQGVVTAMFRNL